MVKIMPNSSPVPLRIALLFTWDVSLKIWAEKGLFEREVLYYKKLAACGVHITFLTWGDESDVIYADRLHPNITVFPLYARFPRASMQIMRAILSPLLLWVSRSVFRTASIVKTNQMWGGWMAVLARLIFRRPLIVRTGFELYRFTCLQNHSRMRRLFIKCMSYLTYKQADLIYLATPEDKAFVEKTFAVDSRRIMIRPNWIDIQTFCLAVPNQRKAQTNRVLYVGRLTAQKNISLLIEALAGTPWGLDIIGHGELKESLQQLGHEKNVDVQFLGSIANDKLPAFYHAHAVFALVSDYEGNPKALLEAMSCGCAVLGTHVEGIASIIESGKNGWLCEKNVDSVRDSLHTLMADQSLRERLGQAAREKIVREQSLDGLVAKEMKDYHSLCRMPDKNEASQSPQ